MGLHALQGRLKGLQCIKGGKIEKETSQVFVSRCSAHEAPGFWCMKPLGLFTLEEGIMFFSFGSYLCISLLSRCMRRLEE